MGGPCRGCCLGSTRPQWPCDIVPVHTHCGWPAAVRMAQTGGHGPCPWPPVAECFPGLAPLFGERAAGRQGGSCGVADRDYYQVLGVTHDADENEIKKAFRQLARRHHPDANREDPGAAEKFKELGQAYAVLSDAQKRAQYDQMGHAAFTAAQRGGAGWPGDGAQGVDLGGFGGFEDLFESVLGEAFFGGSRSRRRPGPERGSDLRTAIEIPFEQAAFGTSVEIAVPRTEACGSCGGSGAAQGSKRVPCAQCGGRGVVQSARATPFGQFVTRQGCPRCGGTGSVVEKPCAECQGNGRIRHRRTIAVHVPAGVENGQRLRLQGEGDAGAGGGPAGDLYVDVRVTAHPLFRRDGADVVSEVTVGLAQAALGAEIEVETLEGKTPLKVPEGTQPGDVLRVRGKGLVPAGARSRGDHRVVIRVEVPKHLSAQEREALRHFAALRGERVDGAEPRSFRRILGR